MQLFIDKQIVEKYNNIVNFFTVSSSLIGIIAHQYFDNTSLLQPTSYLFCSHCFFDLFFCNKDKAIYNLLNISIILFSYIYGIRIDDSNNIYTTIILTELSTIFYIFNKVQLLRIYYTLRYHYYYHIYC